MHVADIAIPSGDRSLRATVFTPDAEAGVPGVLCFPGYRSKRALYYEHGKALAAEVGAVCLTVDISGHGDTPGDLLELKPQDLFDDALAAYDALAAAPTVETDRIGVVGTSFGARLAVQLSRERDPKSLLLRAPAIKEVLPIIPSADDANETKTGSLRKWLGGSSKPRRPTLYEVVAEATREAAQADTTYTRYRPYLPADGLLRAINDYPGAITIVESENDRHVASEYIEACLAVAKHGTHKVIEGAEHVLEGDQRLEYRKIILDWATSL